MLKIVSDPRPEQRSLDQKVIDALAPLAARNREAAKEMVEKVLPVLEKRLAADPPDPSSPRLRVAVVALQAHARGETVVVPGFDR
jgi:hypothetical protein